jgi:L-lactate dehydrogenase (cytochrome)
VLYPVHPCWYDADPSTGEANITKGAGIGSIIQMVSSNASSSYEDIIANAAPTQPLFFQLYKHTNNNLAENRVREVERLGYKAIWLTVDAIVPGNRERDIRNIRELEDIETGLIKVHEGSADEMIVSEEANILGTAGALIANDDRDMTWDKVHSSSHYNYMNLNCFADHSMAPKYYYPSHCHQR